MELTFEGLPEPVSDRGKYVVILNRLVVSGTRHIAHKTF